MSFPVKLYVYDLSNGLAKQISLQLTGRQIDGIWHTSVVVYGKEVLYGQGIAITEPGKSHYGPPYQICDMGETAIDEDTFDEYLTEMRQHYTADKYHLLDFNCNSFSNDCVGFLTGGTIPAFIRDLPQDFLSTPFGSALRPTIDAMFRGPAQRATVPEIPPPALAASPNPALAASILQAVATRAQSNPAAATVSTSAPPADPTGMTAAVQVSTNPASFSSLLRTHRALVAFFTSTTCGPCRMIAPVFEELARAKATGNDVGFAKIDLDVGMGGAVAREWNVRVTPTFLFFLDAQKIHELKGVNGPELRTQVDLLIFQAFPPHPHTRLSLPVIESISLNPILFTQVPVFDSVLSKLETFIDAAPIWENPVSKEQVKETLSNSMLPYLRAKFQKLDAVSSISKATVDRWAQLTWTLASVLPLQELFPLVDIWRLALLDTAVSALCVPPGNATSPINVLLMKASTENPRAYMLTLLRMLCNLFANATLARTLLLTVKSKFTAILIGALLNSDAAVRTAAASLAFNLAAYLQKLRVDKIGSDSENSDEDGDWEVELTSAIVEAIDREKDSKEVVHRLTACLALLLRLSPFYETQLTPLLEVLQAQTVLRRKVEKSGVGDAGLTGEIRKLVLEVAGQLCPGS